MTLNDSNKRAENISYMWKMLKLLQIFYLIKIFLWGGDGRFRASIHGFNNSDDEDKLMTLPKKYSFKKGGIF